MNYQRDHESSGSDASDADPTYMPRPKPVSKSSDAGRLRVPFRRRAYNGLKFYENKFHRGNCVVILSVTKLSVKRRSGLLTP